MAPAALDGLSYATLYIVLGAVGLFVVSLGALMLIFSNVVGEGLCSPVLFMVVIVGASGASFFKGWRDRRQAQWLITQGQRAQAVLVDRWVVGGKRRREGVAFYFEPPDQAGVLRAEVNTKAYRALRVGDTAHVYYHPKQPQVCLLVLLQPQLLWRHQEDR